MNPLRVYRLANWCLRHRVPLMPRILYGLSRLIFHCSIPPSTVIGPGTVLCYGGLGVVIHQRCRIGSTVIIAHEVTIGGRSGHEGVPIIEDDCCIGAGAKVLGPITIGRGAVIGANAVVLHDVPPGAVAAGVPARVRGMQASRDRWQD